MKFILNNKFRILLVIISIAGIIISSINILKWKLDNNNTKEIITKIEETVEVTEAKEENVEIVNQDKIDVNDLYWDYIKMNLINVNFDELKSINSDTVGWIQVNGTNINYPFVQTKDNDYYLNHSFYKKYNGAGWVFMDYRNNITSLDKNTILYGHARLDKTMFGTLKNILKNGWLNDSNNYVIKLSTEYENTLWQVFSIYHIPTTSDYLEINFNTDDEFIEFANMLLNRSMHNFNTTVNKEDHILTLSTCYSNNQKLVLHAKLIKKEIK